MRNWILSLFALLLSAQAFALIEEKLSFLAKDNVAQRFAAVVDKDSLSQEIFLNMPALNAKSEERQQKNYKQFLKNLATLNLNSRVEIGLDQLKVVPLSFKSSEILSKDHALLYSNKQPKSKGYGVELRIKLD